MTDYEYLLEARSALLTTSYIEFIEFLYIQADIGLDVSAVDEF